MTDDKGVQDMLGFLLARDTMHQNQWIAAIKELEEKEGVIVPGTVPPEYEKEEVSHSLYNFSDGEESAQFEWLKGKAPDGAEFHYESGPVAYGEKPVLKPAPKRSHNTPDYGE